MNKTILVQGRKVIDKGSRYVILTKDSKPITSVNKVYAKNPKEAVAIYLEEEDNRYIKMQDKMWDYI